MATGDPDPVFRLSFLSIADDKLRGFAQRAVRLGVTTEFIRDLEYLRQRLRTDPADWGDPLFDYRQLRMTHYRGRSEFLYTHYSVNISDRIVFVQDFDINPYSVMGTDSTG